MRKAFYLVGIAVRATPRIALLVLVLCLTARGAHASTAGGSMPWDSVFTTLSNDLKGPVAFAVSLFGLIGTGATLIWGAEINEWMRRLTMLVLVICLLVFANNVLSDLFGTAAIVT